MPLVNAKCTNCGANIEVDDTQQALVCKFCGSAFVVEQAINNYNITNNVTNNIQAENVTIVQQGGTSDFEIVAGELKKYNGSATDVVIPEGIKSIAGDAFKDSKNSLTSISFPSSIEKGVHGLIGGSSLSAIHVAPDHPQFITKDGILYEKTGTGLHLRRFPSKKDDASFTIPDGVTEIGDSAFKNCYRLTNIQIPDGVTKIYSSAFENCTGLTAIQLPDSITEIGWNAFAGCRSLTSIQIPNGITEIKERTFDYCKALTSVTIPASVIKIGEKAFSYCEALTSVQIPNSVTEIKSYAFEHCNSLTSVTIPASVTTIGDSAFANCAALENVIREGKEEKGIDRIKIFGNTPYIRKKAGGCYVATCVYGSYDCPQVWTLRRFRDNTLAKTRRGRAFIHTYYAVSPTLVKWFGKTKWFRRMWKAPLDRLVTRLHRKGVKDTPYQDKQW